MSSVEDGIKFVCNWKNDAILFDRELKEINHWRSLLHRAGLIGISNGVGYGNISLRIGTTDSFLISGTATGSKSLLEATDVSLVESYNLFANEIYCRGATRASSESPSHAAIYGLSNDINAVVHVHHAGLWLYGRDRWPTSDEQAEYGSPEMAVAIQALWTNGVLCEGQPIVMGGHKDGLLTFGSDLKSATQGLLAAYNKFQNIQLVE
jgi:hypothetical protein